MKSCRLPCGTQTNGCHVVPCSLTPPLLISRWGRPSDQKPSGHRIASGRNEQALKGTDTLEFGGDSRAEVNLLFRLFLQWADT